MTIPDSLTSWLSKELIVIALTLTGLGFTAYVDVTADIAVLQEQEKSREETDERIERKVDEIYKFLLNRSPKEEDTASK
jgi:hypothetical protein